MLHEYTSSHAAPASTTNILQSILYALYDHCAEQSYPITTICLTRELDNYTASDHIGWMERLEACLSK